ncbi:MAG: Zn-dependent hydrolase [Bacteroidota bacterium]
MKKLYLLAVLLILFSYKLKAQKVDAKRMESRILALGEFGKNPQGGVTRLAFSEEDLEAREYTISLMEKAGLSVRIDAAGNIIGRRKGKKDDKPVIIFGSHIDSVPLGGNYDGDVGVIGAIEVIEMMNKNNIHTTHPLEVIVFCNEEGGLVGSSAVSGALSPEGLKVKSQVGLTMAEGIRKIGGNPDKIHEAIRNPEELKAFVELHIEQGSILYDEGLEIGVVEGIVGIGWWDISIEGFANHAGTTPMDKRKDAMVAASELILDINSIATTTPGKQVATVGRIEAKPGAPNVIPGEVVMSLEIRDLSQEKIDQIFKDIKTASQEIEKKYDVQISFEEIELNIAPAPTDVTIRSLIVESAKESGFKYKLMPSGAGHDAQDMAKITPTAMIFVPSVNGISHSPEEFTTPSDMANGATVLYHTILKIDKIK